MGDNTQGYIKNLNKKPYMLNRVNSPLILAIYNFLMESPASDVNIIDFGGACGVRYFEVRRFFPNSIKFKWYVVDTPEMIKSAKNHGLENEELLFVDDMGIIEQNIDFVYCSGSLQYVDYKQILPQFMEFNPKYMLFHRMSFNKNNQDLYMILKSRLSGQDPGGGIPLREKYKDKDIFYPYRVTALNDFLNIIQTKYTLEWSFENEPPDPSDENITRNGLLFKRAL